MEQVSLVVDYGNGATKIFMKLPWTQGMTVSDVLSAAAAAPPGLAIDGFIDRASRQVVRSVDGVEAEDERLWVAWVGTTPIGDRLPTESSTVGAHPPVSSGDAVLLKLSDRPKQE